jgi:hypothetical protein
MDGSGSGGGKEFGRFTAPAHRVLDLAREEAERVAEGRSGAAWALRPSTPPAPARSPPCSSACA